MLVKKTDNKKTTITICKYSDYQISETTEELQKDFKRTSKELQKDTNKNDKECIKKDKENIYSDLPTELHEPLKAYIEMRKGMGKSKAMSSHAINLLIGKLIKLSNGDIRLQIEMLQEATLKNWMSVYLPKQDSQTAAPTECQKQISADKRRQAEQEAEAIIEKERQQMLAQKPSKSINFDFFKMPEGM
jgi:DNA helicase TIP49 (TBP-interacting protein)